MKEGKPEKLPDIELRELQPTIEDATEYFDMLHYHGNPEHFGNFRNMDVSKYPSPEAVLAILIRSSSDPQGKHRWGIRYKGKLIGVMNIDPEKGPGSTMQSTSKGNGEIGYLVHRRTSEMKVGTAALKKLIEMESSNYSSLSAKVHKDNEWSWRLLEKFNFVHTDTIGEDKIYTLNVSK